MRNLPILALIFFTFISCHPTEEEVEMLWQRHLEFKENKLSELRKEFELDEKSSIALLEIDSIKTKIRTNSKNLMQVSYSANSLLQDNTTMKPLFESIKATNFSNSHFADIKYDNFGNKTGNLYGWNTEFFRYRTAAEALLLLTDIQYEILNYEMTARSENPDLLERRSQKMKELTTHE